MILRRLAAFVLFALLLQSEAKAHKFQHPKTMRMGIKADKLLLSVTYDVNPGREALQTRALFDRNTDGKLDGAEQKKLMDYLQRTAALWLKVWVDDRPAKPKLTSIEGHKLDLPSSATDTLGASMLFVLKLPSRPKLRLKIADRTKDRRKHVPVIVDIGPGWRVNFANQGELHPTARRLRRVRLQAERPLVLELDR